MQGGSIICRPLQALVLPHAHLRRHASCPVCCQARRSKSSAAGTVAPEAQLAAPPPAVAAQHASPAAAEPPDADELQDGQGGDFHAFFGHQWGPRWRRLFAALAAPTRHVALHNAFLLRPPAADDLPGAMPLQPGAGRHPALAAALQAAAAAAGGAGDGTDSSHSGSSASTTTVQALHWEPAEPAGPDAAFGYPPPPTDATAGLSTHYWLDPASLLPPLLLGVQPGQQVLDMCAAPGGKSLVLAHFLFAAQHAAAAAAGGGDDGASATQGSGSRGAQGDGARRGAVNGSAAADVGYSGQLVCNELDTGRRGRLLRVLKAYVPADVRQHMRVTPHDAARWWGRQEAESFDRVLLDAPCSSDRHVAQQAAERGTTAVPRAAWSAQRCRRISGDQARLLAAGVKALRPGGRLVYSTCSIAELENDKVIDRVLDKAGGSLAVISHTLQPLRASGPGCSASASASGSAADGKGAATGHDPAAAAMVASLEGMGAERTRHGWLLLPDATSPPCGPIYLAVLHKAASSDLRRVKVNKYAGQSRAGGGGGASGGQRGTAGQA
ncbi:hypothetical protein ABPG77_003791 [Micractinium sp. CCAP 211/92]